MLSKCLFGVREANIHVHRANSEGAAPSVAHVVSIKALVDPGCGEELMRFLGLASYFPGKSFLTIYRPLRRACTST